MEINLPNDFMPRPYQERVMAYFDAGGKKAFWLCHRRAGKDLTAMHQTCKMAHDRVGAYWHIYPTFAQARKAIWEGFRKDGKRIMENVFPGFLNPKRKGSIVWRKDEQQMAVFLKSGSIWRLLGSDRVELVGAGPIGVVFSEYALSNPAPRRLIRPMLLENGGWEFYITTPRGNNHAKELFDLAVKDPSWFCETRTINDTGAWKEFSDAEGKPFESAEALMDYERRNGQPDPIVKQEYLCDWTAALVGSVYGDLVDALGKMGGLSPFHPHHDEVFTAWDLGSTDNTAIWFWRVKDGGVDFIDYYANNGKPLQHYFDIVNRKPYRYIKHWLPHDARQVTLASGVSILNQCMREWPGLVNVCPKMPVSEGIYAGRWLLQQGVRFHPLCHDGIQALRNYHYEYDEEKKVMSQKPKHDWSSHGADAFRYAASVVHASKLISKPVEAPAPAKLPYREMGSFKLEELFADRQRQIAARRRIS